LVLEMQHNVNYQTFLNKIGMTPKWKQEHRRRAMSLAPITGIDIDPRDLLRQMNRPPM
jgi:hypothetical protein